MSILDIITILLIVFLIFYVTILIVNFINKKLKYKFIKYIPSVVPLYFIMYFIFELFYKHNCIGWEGAGCVYGLLFFSFIFIDILISCIIVDLINYKKKKKHKK